VDQSLDFSCLCYSVVSVGLSSGLERRYCG